MILAQVAGTVVGTERNDSMDAPRYLLVDLCGLDGRPLDDFLVAVDTMGAGVGEVVLVSQGSSARQTRLTDKKPVDAVIVGIVDLVEENGSIVFRK